ncbi:beta-flanking protein [Gelatoporia subvermispora B]|uniref:Beta-flanking protein n=1 Tax=Ceriporiopsis subvermispora (strain B) TaxID=914234 RepID=M2RSK7_CERS8|nr:beta-flanking protein [Gelatoporia subvermispora B]
MDSFMNMAKQGYEAYERSHSDVSRTGGQEYNSPHQSGQGGQPLGYGRPQFNEDEVVNTASQHGSGDSSLFSGALSYVSQNQHEHEQPVDEQHVQDAHRVAYQEGAAGNLSAPSMGSAAAMQIMKQFTSGGGGGGSQSQLISLAMAEASKLFESAGGAASGNKQDAVNGAAMTVMKLIVQSKFSGAIGGGNSGGLSGLMGLGFQVCVTLTLFCGLLSHISAVECNHACSSRGT